MDITFKSRYGELHTLKEIAPNLYLATDVSRIIGEFDDIKAIDFDGGPFLSVGAIIGEDQDMIQSFKWVEGKGVEICCI